MTKVINLLYVNLAVSVVLAALTVVFYDQFANIPGAWIKPVIVLVVSAIYLRIAQRLRQGVRSAYIRVLVISVLGFLGQVYAAFGTPVPVWMRLGDGVQALVLVALFVAVVQPEVRNRFAAKAKTEAVA